MFEGIGLVVIFIVAALLLALFIYRANLHIAPKNKALVFSGRRHSDMEGNAVGYKIITGGRGWKIPMIERVDSLDLTSLPIELKVEDAITKDGVMLDIVANANVKISSDPRFIGNAVERLLGKTNEELDSMALETLAGNLRGVLATMEPREVNANREEFLGRVQKDATYDLEQLGFTLDTLNIKDISDKGGFLEALGRSKTAEVLKEAEVGENNSQSEARQGKAEAERRAKETEIENQRVILDKEKSLRLEQAKLEEETAEAEERAKAARDRAAALSQQAVEQERIILQKTKLEAEVVTAADAQKQAEELRAIGSAAEVREKGKANLEILEEQLSKIKSYGEVGVQVLMVNHLPQITQTFADALKNLDIERLVVLDGGENRGGLANLVSGAPSAIISMMEQLRGMGIDVSSILSPKPPASVPADDGSPPSAVEGGAPIPSQKPRPN